MRRGEGEGGIGKGRERTREVSGSLSDSITQVNKRVMAGEREKRKDGKDKRDGEEKGRRRNYLGC